MKPVLLLCFLFTSLFLNTKAQSKTVPGTVIAYSPAASGLYIGSPSIAILPDGKYVASHDFFGPKSNEHVKATSKIYTSADKGKTWTETATILGAFWSKLFVHQGKLYLLGTDRHHGNTVIRRSEDGGVHWTEPTGGATGLLLAGEYHCAPVPLIYHNKRLWRAMEDAMGPVKEWGKRYGAMMLSIAEDQDLLQAEHWTSSNVLRYDPAYLGGKFRGWLEGNAVIGPDNTLYDLLRVDAPTLNTEKAAVVTLSKDGKTASFDPEKDFIDFPGGSKKFAIYFDRKSKLYWTLSNMIPDTVKQQNPGKNPASIRNTLGLFSSPDLQLWTLKKVLLQHPDIARHGFQYVDWQFEGKDIIFVSRTAYDDSETGAHNNHDANYLTFHRIRHFRKLR